MFLFLGNTLWQTSQGNCPRFPSWISDMCTRRFFWFPKYLLHTPHINFVVGGSTAGLFSFVLGNEGKSNFGTLSGEPLAIIGVALLLGDSVIADNGWAGCILVVIWGAETLVVKGVEKLFPLLTSWTLFWIWLEGSGWLFWTRL